MDDGITGLVLSAKDPCVWERAIDGLLKDTPRRMRMSRTASQRMGRFALSKTFEGFWEEHLGACAGMDGAQGAEVHAEACTPV